MADHSIVLGVPASWTEEKEDEGGGASNRGWE